MTQNLLRNLIKPTLQNLGVRNTSNPHFQAPIVKFQFYSSNEKSEKMTKLIVKTYC